MCSDIRWTHCGPKTGGSWLWWWSAASGSHVRTGQSGQPACVRWTLWIVGTIANCTKVTTIFALCIFSETNYMCFYISWISSVFQQMAYPLNPVIYNWLQGTVKICCFILFSSFSPVHTIPVSNTVLLLSSVQNAFSWSLCNKVHISKIYYVNISDSNCHFLENVGLQTLLKFT
jgi:hypothetical protein